MCRQVLRGSAGEYQADPKNGRVRLSVTPWTAAYQAPPSVGFSRQEYWSGVPLPSPLTHANIGQIHSPQWIFMLKM